MAFPSFIAVYVPIVVIVILKIDTGMYYYHLIYYYALDSNITSFIMINVNHGSQNVFWVLTWVGGY